MVHALGGVLLGVTGPAECPGVMRSQLVAVASPTEGQEAASSFISYTQCCSQHPQMGFACVCAEVWLGHPPVGEICVVVCAGSCGQS